MSKTVVRGGTQLRDQTVLIDDFREFSASDGGGLNLDLEAGRIRNDNTITDKATQTVALTDDATNFVELDNVGAATANTSAFTTGKIPVARVITASGSISSIADKRSWVSVGGGAAGITGSGTTGTLAKFTGSTAVGDSILLESSSKIGVGATPSDAAQFQVDKSLSTGVVALADGATPALDASLGNTFTLTAVGDRTIAIPTNPTDRQKIVIAHTASGADRTLSLNTGTGGFRFGTDITALTATTSGKTDYIGCIYNGTDNKWDVVAVTKGF